MSNAIELKVNRDGARTTLTVPDVGLFTAARDAGDLLAAGEHAGILVQLGVSRNLVVPADVTGRIVNARPDRVMHPVGYGDVIYELEPIESSESATPEAKTKSVQDAGGLTLRAPHTGRFWHRPSPDDPAFCEVGSTLAPGDAVGLIEIMKTFTQISYTPSGELPERAKVVKMLASDGEDVTEGTPLIEVEPA